MGKNKLVMLKCHAQVRGGERRSDMFALRDKQSRTLYLQDTDCKHCHCLELPTDGHVQLPYFVDGKADDPHVQGYVQARMNVCEGIEVDAFAHRFPIPCYVLVRLA